jgi:hypothetical protein
LKSKDVINTEATSSPILDPDQLVRIEAVHRGFLYQHLYAACCLLLAQNAGATSIAIERDEDVEVIFADRRLYVQVKTRKNPLVYSDVDTAIERFDALRLDHKSGARTGDASFVIAANVRPGPGLLKRLEEPNWPSDVQIHWPDCPAIIDDALPHPWPDIGEAIAKCSAFSATLPFGLLAPDTLTWKLAGCVMLAASGTPPRDNHADAVLIC